MDEDEDDREGEDEDEDEDDREGDGDGEGEVEACPSPISNFEALEKTFMALAISSPSVFSPLAASAATVAKRSVRRDSRADSSSELGLARDSKFIPDSLSGDCHLPQA
jgi:hypothetical protein